MTDLSTQMKKLEQKKARLLKQETLLKIKERKQRVRHLIEKGGILAKAEIDHLPSDILLGAALFIKDTMTRDKELLDKWKQRGAQVFQDQIKHKTPLILSMKNKPDLSTRTLIRSHGLKWNPLRKEWYGYVKDLETLKKDLHEHEFSLTKLQKENPLKNGQERQIHHKKDSHDPSLNQGKSTFQRVPHKK